MWLQYIDNYYIQISEQHRTVATEMYKMTCFKPQVLLTASFFNDEFPAFLPNPVSVLDLILNK